MKCSNYGQFLILSLINFIHFPLLEPLPIASANDIEKLKQGVVKITVRGLNDRIETGAGIIVGADERDVYILTALHVVLDNEAIAVQFYEYRRRPVLGALYPEFDEDIDLAVITVSWDSLAGMEIRFDALKTGDLGKLKELDEIIALGHPADSPWQLSAGKVGKLETNEIQFTGDAIHPGNSGGALLNAKRHLVGIVSRRSTEVGHAVRLDVVKDKLQQWNVPVQLELAPPSRKWLWIGVGSAAAIAAIIYFKPNNGGGGLSDLPGPPDPN